MSSYHSFKKGLDDLVRFNQNRWFLYLFIRLVLLALGTLFFYNLMVMVPGLTHLIPWYFIFCISMGVLTTLFFFKKRAQVTDVLKGLDDRLFLKDLLMSAYEFYPHYKKQRYVDELLGQAGETLKKLDFKKLYPFELKVDLLFILLLSISIIIFPYPALKMIFSPREIKTERAHHPDADKEQQSVKPLMTPSDKEKDHTSENNLIKNEASRIEKDPKDASIIKKKGDTPLPRHKKELLNALSEELFKTGFYYDALISLMDDVNTGKVDMAQLNKIINKAYEGKVPKEISRTLDDLLNDDLEGIRSPMDEDELLAGEVSMDKNPSKDNNKAKPSSSPEKYFENKNLEKGGGKSVGEKDNDGNRFKEDGSDRKSDDPFGSDVEDEEKSENKGEISDMAGNIKAEGLKKDETKIPEAKGDVFRSFGERNKKEKRYGFGVYSHAPKGSERSYPPSVLKTYKEERESVLFKENLPTNYQKYIKTYFLLIGMEKELNDE